LGGQDSTGVIPRRQAGFYPVIFYYPPKKWAVGWGAHDPLPSCFAVPGQHIRLVGRCKLFVAHSFVIVYRSVRYIYIYTVDYNKKMSNNCDKSSENYQYFVGYTTENIPTRHSEHHLPATSLEHMILFLPWPLEHCKIHISSQPSISSMSFTYSHNRSVIKLF
jgi:hypothetical protein